MKKCVYIIALVLLCMACGSYRSLDLRKLTTGMSKAQVEQIAGVPNRLISIKETDDGYQEVLEYSTSRNEIYALEFWNDYLVGYEYLYEDIQYVAPMYPPTIYPPYGRPIYIAPGNNRPQRPNRPGQPDRPNQPNQPNRPNRPGQPDRPGNAGTGGNQEGNKRPTTRPAEGSRPVRTPK
ncbi:hypothetical protein M2101_001016 [Parabacteroides sp. PM5-20]|uniref:hypothetical protein n=1 Tax=unclassified Parabacteroides TaxID=2649774 RepID=UPI0013CF80B8|nr:MULTISPECIES: hypothetical protein [unclassified Parabacteroides]MDH6534348.1 hypothetical protein [Parabacteroides sp. PM5-20]